MDNLIAKRLNEIHSTSQLKAARALDKMHSTHLKEKSVDRVSNIIASIAAGVHAGNEGATAEYAARIAIETYGAILLKVVHHDER